MAKSLVTGGSGLLALTAFWQLFGGRSSGATTSAESKPANSVRADARVGHVEP